MIDSRLKRIVTSMASTLLVSLIGCDSTPIPTAPPSTVPVTTQGPLKNPGGKIVQSIKNRPPVVEAPAAAK